MQGNALTAVKWLGGLFLVGCTIMVGGMVWIFSKPSIASEPRIPTISNEAKFLGPKG